MCGLGCGRQLMGKQEHLQTVVGIDPGSGAPRAMKHSVLVSINWSSAFFLLERNLDKVEISCSIVLDCFLLRDFISCISGFLLMVMWWTKVSLSLASRDDSGGWVGKVHATRSRLDDEEISCACQLGECLRELPIWWIEWRTVQTELHCTVKWLLHGRIWPRDHIMILRVFL